MKKIPILLLAIFLLAGCSFFQKKEDVPAAELAEITLERKIGIVGTPDQETLNPKSPFVLLTETNEKHFIDSLTVNLKRYTNRRVEVSGKWNDERTVLLVESVVSLGQETQIKEKFVSPNFGMSFQYPKIWVLLESQDAGLPRVTITPYQVDEGERVDTFTVERSENNRKLSPREWLGLDEEYRSKNAAEEGMLYQQSTIGVGALDAVKRTAGSGEKVEFFVGRDVFMYHFIHETVGDSERDLYRNAFYDLVQSFEFIPFGEMRNEVTARLPQLPDDPAEKTLTDLAGEEQARRREAEELVQKTNELAESRNKFIAYIQENIKSYAVDLAMGSVPTVTRVEFAAPEKMPEQFFALYAEYTIGSDARRILLEIPDRKDPKLLKRAAYFEPGEYEDWKLVSGVDSAKGSERTVFVVSGSEKNYTVKPGMTYLSLKYFKASIQYPTPWYWAYRREGYDFGSKPISGENHALRLTKNPATLPSDMQSIGELGGKAATQGEMAEAVSICVETKAKFCLSGRSDNPDIVETIKKMLSTLAED